MLKSHQITPVWCDREDDVFWTFLAHHHVPSSPTGLTVRATIQMRSVVTSPTRHCAALCCRPQRDHFSSDHQLSSYMHREFPSEETWVSPRDLAWDLACPRSRTITWRLSDRRRWNSFRSWVHWFRLSQRVRFRWRFLGFVVLVRWLVGPLLLVVWLCRSVKKNMKRKKEKSLGSLETLCSRNLVLHVQFVFFLSKLFNLFQRNFFF